MFLKKLSLIKFFLYFIFLSFTFLTNAKSSNTNKQINENPTDDEIFEKLNTKLDLNLTFTNQNGKKESLKDILEEKKILILTLNYFSCTTMCTFQFLNLSKALQKMNWPIGKGFKIVTISFDPKDTIENSKLLKENWAPKTGQKNAQWDFYVSTQENIQSLTKQLNFYYKPDSDGETYSHIGALYFIKPDGTFYRYLYGISYEAEDIKHALIDTSNGELGSFLEKLPLKFKKYQPKIGKYTPN
ncbi:SCO family protein [Fluviispira vulneris]|uniref:SCO family protein n=1 Tax=Fluviispira vulneris TaxID=2763012 RepID=UPI001646558C|nr:SCO family protein [Fluviispira vulneris]